MKQFLSVTVVGEICQPVQVKQVDQHKVAITKIKVSNSNSNGQKFSQTFNLEGWNEIADKISRIQVGTVVMAMGSLKNEKYHDENGNEKWTTKINPSTLGIVQNAAR